MSSILPDNKGVSRGFRKPHVYYLQHSDDKEDEYCTYLETDIKRTNISLDGD